MRKKPFNGVLEGERDINERNTKRVYTGECSSLP